MSKVVVAPPIFAFVVLLTCMVRIGLAGLPWLMYLWVYKLLLVWPVCRLFDSLLCEFII